MYSLIRVWIGLKLARIVIQVRVVVRTTSATDRPSDAELVLDAEGGDPVELSRRTGSRAVRANSR